MKQPEWGYWNRLETRGTRCKRRNCQVRVESSQVQGQGHDNTKHPATQGLFLIESNSGTEGKHVLCRCGGGVTAGPTTFEQKQLDDGAAADDFVICYDDAIQVISLHNEQQLYGGGATCEPSKMYNLENDFSLLFQINDTDNSNNHEGYIHRSIVHVSRYHHHPLAMEKNDGSFIYQLDSMPCPLLSLFLQERRQQHGNHQYSLDKGKLGNPPHQDDSSKALEPLFWSCIKRQLVGCVILFHPQQITTRLSIPLRMGDGSNSVVILQVTKAIPLPRSQYHEYRNKQTSVVYVVLPSTNITVTTEDDIVDMTTRNDKQQTAQLLLDSQIPNIGMISPVARRLMETIGFMRHQYGHALCRSILLTGPPGVGKTHAVRLAFQFSEEQGPTRLWSIRGSELLANNSYDDSSSTASTALKQIFHKTFLYASQSERHIAMIFLDECDALVASHANDDDATTAAVSATLAWLLDRVNNSVPCDNNDAASAWERVLVVAATNRLDVIPSFLRRPGRFDQEMTLAPPTASERKSLLQNLLKLPQHSTDSERKQEENDELSNVADACVGYVPADLVALVRRATFLELQDGWTEDGNIKAKYLLQAMADVGASALRDAALSAPPNMGWDDVAGDPGGAKTALRQAVEWPRTRKASYLRLGLSPPRGILLHGPPGCAKTSLARAAAGASGIAFLSYSPADVYSSSYVGEAESVVRNAFSLARSAAPCILFFDEIDSILGGSNNNGSSGIGLHRRSSAEARVLSTFLNEMDGVDGSPEDGVLVLAATNRPWTLDAALLRPGRLEKIIFVPPPDMEGRKSILEMSCPQQSSGCNDSTEGFIDFDYLASDDVSGSMTGAELVGACREAAGQVLRDFVEQRSPLVVTQEKIESALRAVQPLLSNPATMAEYHKFWKRSTRI